ncbi:MAG: nucleotidyltransferase domain-containing protein [Syntrophales bacterium]|nr:nucleotidyltransferase domain-containing protein [Syntrophales bacterium]
MRCTRKPPVPMEFEFLLRETVDDKELRVEIDELLKRKRSGKELDYAPRIPVISEFIEAAPRF